MVKKKKKKKTAILIDVKVTTAVYLIKVVKV